MKNNLTTTNHNAKLALTKSKILLSTMNNLLPKKENSSLTKKFKFKPYFSDGHFDSVESLAITPDGKTIISGSSDNTIKLWNINSGMCVNTLNGHVDSVNSLVITPDGNIIISGSQDKTIKLWDIKSGKCINTFENHMEKVSKLEDGSCIYTLNDGSTITMFLDGSFNASEENINKFIRVQDTPLSCRKLTEEEIKHFCKIKYDNFDINKDEFKQSKIPEIGIDDDEIPF